MATASEPSLTEPGATAGADALAAARWFLGTSAPMQVRPWGSGLINSTYRVEGGGAPWLLQRINTAVFPDPDAIMGNWARLRAQADASGGQVRVPRVCADPDGRVLLRDADGGVWRLIEFIADSRTLAALESPAQAREVGRVLGAFHRLGAGLDPAALAITLPGFHDSETCLAALDRTVAAADAPSAADPRVLAALAFIDVRRGLVGTLSAAARADRLPTRVTHGDPKLDNLLFSADGRRALCLIDLDTVQPGLVHHDLGDCLRSCCNRRGESGRPADTRFDFRLAAPILAGWAGAADGLLSADEVALLPAAIRLLPLELGIRFLADHLAGDRYFRVRARGENLTKAEVQFALVADLEANADALHDLIHEALPS